MARGYGIGASLASIGQEQHREAMRMVGEAANQEQQRNIANQQIEQQTKAGNMQLGSTLGATVGSAFGPLGTLAGGAIGAIAAGFLS